MSAKKVLFISPTPTHPTNAGNRQHIKSLVLFFKEQMWEVHFLYLAYENYDLNAMRSFFGDNLHLISKKDIFQNRKTVPYIFQKAKGKLDEFKRKIQRITGAISKNQYLYNSEVDSHFSVFIKPAIEQLQKNFCFNVVVCEYAMMSKAFNFFDDSVYKILDAHDKFTDRYQMYLNNKLNPSWYSFFEQEERKALKRADLVIALQERERNYFEKLSGTKSIRFFTIPPFTQLPAKQFEKKLLFFASDNPVNLKTLQYFEENILPAVKRKHPDVLLLVGGAVCNNYTKKDGNVHLLGMFNSCVDFYKLGDIVINPEQEGTGLKIKTVEALSFGLPVVCTKAGAVGLTDIGSDHLLIADNIDLFSTAVIEMIENDGLREKISIKAKQWVELERERVKEELLHNLETIVLK